MKMLPAARRPGVEVEARSIGFLHTMGMQDITLIAQQSVYRIRRIIAHIGIDPQHPVFISERSKQQMVSTSREHRAPRQLKRRSPSGHAGRHPETEILLEDNYAFGTVL